MRMVACLVVMVDENIFMLSLTSFYCNFCANTDGASFNHYYHKRAGSEYQFGTIMFDSAKSLSMSTQN